MPPGPNPSTPPDAEPDETPSRIISTPGREQEQSIRDRKHLLFDDEELPEPLPGSASAAPPIVAKPFREYLKTTPPAPLSTATRAALYAVAALVLLLLLAALLKMS